MSEDEFYTFAKWDKDAPAAIPVEKEEEKEKEEVKEVLNTAYGAVINYPHKGFLRNGYNALRLRSTPTSSESNNIVGQIGQGYTFLVYKEVQFGDDIWWLVELPNSKVGWGARRIQGVTFLEYAE